MNLAELLKLNKDQIQNFAENKHVTRETLFIQAWKTNRLSNPNGQLFTANNKDEFCQECHQFREMMKDIGVPHGLKLKDTKTPDYLGDLWMCDVEFERTNKSLGVQKQLKYPLSVSSDMKSL